MNGSERSPGQNRPEDCPPWHTGPGLSRPEDNAWYLLATLYGEPNGEPTRQDAELRARNRTAWNRYMARALTEEDRALLRQEGHPAKELTPFSIEEMPDIEHAFEQRHRQVASAAEWTIPDPLESGKIDLSRIAFNKRLFSVAASMFDRLGGFSSQLASGFRYSGSVSRRGISETPCHSAFLARSVHSASGRILLPPS